MGAIMILSGCLVVVGVVATVLVNRVRIRELDRDFVLELACGHQRALALAAQAARGILWQVEFTGNGLYTRHIRAGNIVHIAFSDHPGRPDRTVVTVWTRCRLADNRVFVPVVGWVPDTRRKRDRILRALAAHRVRGGRDATIR